MFVLNKIPIGTWLNTSMSGTILFSLLTIYYIILFTFLQLINCSEFLSLFCIYTVFIQQFVLNMTTDGILCSVDAVLYCSVERKDQS